MQVRFSLSSDCDTPDLFILLIYLSVLCYLNLILFDNDSIEWNYEIINYNAKEKERESISLARILDTRISFSMKGSLSK